ncbi:translation elongation factor Ts [Candidatus Falkowbacteria bacterium RIFOXYB2_FULL_34_18]|uniref:Elongation factor Ts n=1 Tax=Candidatus Falkowbacteria bacterium RIFOXYD2_FULL_34_120 TaxID=1798007 RepID=A0A1F5TQ10_9BACT|nr:MAG: translation elongation factor Ts [Candidatus Falkowbacteria bacterium RIFOXYB2_FULL_34_18]OGF29270.1 MAG: translation elongation factor Ts [Candidatus Falkowbacteria bacterium RIFOXYC12_FULL_34_55]OGF36386.1 MAG: translation elongation factor Ts [Candidatus Falkowbacteria bacterium RIFOXYC2_FULL_34_220]OGF38865.1 MAG: translation elongation factor Ts [Candidatus Falkowbacteria bacterium RIFOXYD12_FULL_34_57]OGF40884.1 MAG: translation elongation factor Ts [Candidatus Falkowbacteria bact
MEKIKELREKTGAGMVSCKKALEEAGGDINKAIEILRKQGIAKAAKRSARETSEGVIKLAVNEAKTEGYIIEINAETDFVAKNEKFQNFGDNVLRIVINKKPKDLECLLGLDLDGSTVGDTLANLSGTIGEKMEIKRFNILSSQGTVAAYSHMGGKIGALVALDKPQESGLAYDIAMQVAAADPKYINIEDVNPEEIKKEKEIYKEQLLKEGKQENMIDKILNGKINKHFEDVCLLRQDFIKEDKKKIEDVLGGVKVERFIRYSL